MAASKNTVYWMGAKQKFYPSQSALVLRVAKFREEIKVELVQKSPSKTHTLILKPGTDNVKKGIRELDPGSNFNGTKVDSFSDDPAENPCLYLVCNYKRGSKVKTLGKKLPVSIQVDDSSPDNIELTLKCSGRKDRTVYFLWRRRTKKDKFLEFLEWQSQCIYGPTKAWYQGKDAEFQFKNQWDFVTKNGKLFVSATGDKGPCITCSPMVAVFLGYWLNFNQHFTFLAGGSRKKLSQKAGGPGRINGYGDFLDPKKRTTSGGKEVLNWTWRTFYDFLKTDAKVGDVYMCCSGGHAWLMVKFGPGFTFPKKYIFGKDATGDCEEGFYRVHASGPAPYAVLWKDHTPASLKKLAKEYRKKKTSPMLQTIAENLEAAIEEAEVNDDIESFKVFRGTNLAVTNAKIEDVSGTIKGLIVIKQDGKKVYSKMSGNFWAWKLKAEAVDDTTGLIKPSTDELPTNLLMWPKKGKKTRVDLSANDCRPLMQLPTPSPAATGPPRLKVSLGIEIDPTAGCSTEAEFALGTPGSGHDPLSGYSVKKTYGASSMTKSGKLSLLEIDPSLLQNRCVRVRAKKNKTLWSYNKKTGATSFSTGLKETEELLTEIHIFKGTTCLTGSQTVAGVLGAMNTTKTGINRILIQLTSNGKSMRDCIVDGVYLWKNGKKLI